MANYDRRILVPYLQDVCSAEMLCSKLTRDINNCKHRINNINAYINQPLKNPIYPNMSDYAEISEQMGCFGSVLMGLGFIALSLYLWKWLSFLCIAGIVVGVVVIYGSCSSAKEESDYSNAQYDAALERYQKEKNYNEEVKKNIPHQQQMLQKEQQFLSTLQQQLYSAQRLRDNVYSVNVIPSRYRNIHVAYYLYDYFNSCRETDLDKIIQTMLLDEIIQRLDRIIAQNEQIMLNQRMHLAMQEKQNRMMAEQHREEMKSIARMEKNQQLQLDYQDMIAKNQMVTNFFLEADYLRKYY